MTDIAHTQQTATESCSTRPSNADVNKHIGLVNQVVSRFMRKLPANVDRGDLLVAGMMGLASSLERNGGDGGGSFEGYAKMRIRGAIVDELRSQDWLSRRARWAANGQGEGYDGPVAMVGFEDVNERERLSRMVDEATPCALSMLEAMGTSRELRELVDQLPERERTIVSMHYFDGVLLKDIGKTLGVSEPRISQLHSRAISRLREMITRAA
jgi:RNA polymerase sigma factor FliA